MPPRPISILNPPSSTSSDLGQHAMYRGLLKIFPPYPWRARSMIESVVLCVAYVGATCLHVYSPVLALKTRDSRGLGDAFRTPFHG